MAAGDVPGRRGAAVPRGPQPPPGQRGRGGVRRQGDRRPRAGGPILTCFLILFAAEWGDLSQLLTISLVAKYDDPVSVFIGALGALLAGQRPGRDRRPGAAALHLAARAALRRRRRSACCSPASRRTSCSPEAVRAAPTRLSAMTHDLTARRRQRGRPAPDRDAPPPRAGAEAADAAQQRQAALRRHPVGRPGAGRARRLRRRRCATATSRCSTSPTCSPRRSRARTPATTRSPPRWPGCTSATRCATTSPGALRDASPEELTGYLTAGIRNDEVRGGFGLVTSLFASDDFLIDPLPNLLFTRDSSVWVQDRVAITSLAMPARDPRDPADRADLHRAPALPAAPARSTAGTTSTSRAATSCCSPRA